MQYFKKKIQVGGEFAPYNHLTGRPQQRGI